MLLGLALVGCRPDDFNDDSAAPEPVTVTLLAPPLLVPVPAADDPLADHRPSSVDCPEAAWGPEGGGFEVQTGVCGYAAFDQPLAERPSKGNVLEITIWHDILDALEPAVGHVAVWLDDRVIWEETVTIPAASDQLDAQVVLDFTPSPGARLGLHLHNHGYNSWRFMSVSATTR